MATHGNSGDALSGQDGGQHPMDADAIHPHDEREQAASQPDDRPVVPTENIDPLRSRISKPRHRKGIWRIMGRIFSKPELTAEQKAAMAEKARRQALEAQLRKEAALFKERIINALNTNNICYRYPKSKNDLLHRGIQQVRFERVVMQPDAFYFQLDVQHLPQGVNILDVVNDQRIIDHLSVACGHTVHGRYAVTNGAWFIVERAGGALGIPAHVMWSHLMELIPDSADGMSLPLGVTTNGKRIYRSLNEMYHMLIGGTTGAGKSNVLNAFICALIMRNPPERLRLLMVDLKGGLEFASYEGIPHLLEVTIPPKKTDKSEDCTCPPEPEVISGIAYKREQVPPILEWLMQEGERRICLLKGAEVRDIGRYNQRHRAHPLAHLVFVVDEIADLKIDSDNWKRCMTMLTNICQRLRAVGIHVILCTQIPRADVVPTEIKGVMPAVMAFNCPTNTSSMTILDTGDAKGLTPVGRCIFRWREQVTLQTPLINDDQIKSIVTDVREGKLAHAQIKSHDVTELEMQTWALEWDNGWLAQRRLFAQFQKRGITNAEIGAWLQSWEGQEVVVGSSIYKVEPPAGNKARRLVSIDNRPEREVTNG